VRPVTARSRLHRARRRLRAQLDALDAPSAPAPATPRRTLDLSKEHAR
jgi:hypothetical protein